MIDRFAWNCFHRPDHESRWTWIASGATYGEAHAAGLLNRPQGELVVLFGRTMPDDKGRQASATTRRWR